MKTAILGHLGPFSRILFVVMLILTCMILAVILGILLAIPIYHVNLVTDMSRLSDLNDPVAVNVMKYLQVIQAFGIFIIPPLLAGYLFEKNSWQWLGVKKFPGGMIFIIVILLMFFSIPFISWLVTINESMKLPAFLGGIEEWMRSTEDQATQLTTTFLDVTTLGGFLVNILMIVLLPAVGEELLFRGLLQRLFSDWFRNAHLAILFTALVFGVVHLQFYGLLPRMMLGVIFGYLYYWTGSLWAPVFAHFLNNGAVVIASYLSNTGVIHGDYENFGNTGNVFLVTGSILFTALLMLFVFTRKKKPVHFTGSDDFRNEQPQQGNE
jgi:uncharacterized protein